MKNTFLLAMAFLGLVGTVHAKPIDFSKVSAESNWVIHADLEALRKSEVGSFIIAKAKQDPEIAKGINSLKVIFGLDIDALSSLTAYGRGEPKKGIISAQGGIDAERLQALVALNQSYSSEKHGDTVIHIFDKHTGDAKAAAFTAKDALMLSPSAGFTKHGLDVASGKAPALEPKGIYQVVSSALPRPILMAAVNIKGIAEFIKAADGPEAAIIQKANAIGLVVGETGDKLMAAVILEASDEETASHVENVVRGFTSLLSLGADMEPDLAELLAKTKTSVTRDGRIVSVKLGIDNDIVKGTIAREMAKKQANQARPQ